MNDIRLLTPADLPALDAFLATAPASNMIMRSNLKNAGLVDGPKPYQGAYAAIFKNGAIIAAAAHYWTNNIILFAPTGAGELAEFLHRHTQRPVMGLIGPWNDSITALDHLGVRHRTIDKPPHQEILYELKLVDLVVPANLADGSVNYRPATPDDAETLIGWRIDYEVETIRYERTAALEARVRETMARTIAGKDWWVATVNGTPVAMSSFNARLSGMVQVGGVHTPKHLRGRGYARVAVAGSLLDARNDGASLGILFTEITNTPAQKIYETLGFKRIGDYALIMLHAE
ncbi:MAG: GNAT family N-acetyltransferase [Rhodospirillaceae bacterium]|nr:GNAT family N-acetyltransferase [Rhodospirillaceae bacterium]